MTLQSKQDAQSDARGELRVADEKLEVMKWLGLVAMTGDHVNKYLLAGNFPLLFVFGRLALPLFTFVLAYNLTRPSAFNSDVHRRMTRRLAHSGVLATPAFVALNDLPGGWWPLNIMFMLLVAVLTIDCLQQGRFKRLSIATLLLVVGGGLVEFWWAGLLLTLTFWKFCRGPTPANSACVVLACAAVHLVNGNHGALAGLALILAHRQISARPPENSIDVLRVLSFASARHMVGARVPLDNKRDREREP